VAEVRIYYCPRHGRIVASTTRGKRTLTVCEPPFHPGCECEKWFFKANKFRAKRGGES